MKKQQADQILNVNHKSSHSKSSQNYRGLVNDFARAVLQGTIHVEKNAQKTDARQQSKSLLLTEKASAFAKPFLVIEADDVKCTHGSTVSPLRQDEIFYLRSRGLPAVEARNMLCASFAKDILQKHQYPGTILETNCYKDAWNQWLQNLQKEDR